MYVLLSITLNPKPQTLNPTCRPRHQVLGGNSGLSPRSRQGLRAQVLGVSGSHVGFKAVLKGVRGFRLSDYVLQGVRCAVLRLLRCWA